MRKKEANLTAIMLVQQLEDDYWQNWDDITPVQLAREGNIRPLLEAVTDKLNKADIPVKEAYGIKHDKDEISIWKQELKKNVNEKKWNISISSSNLSLVLHCQGSLSLLVSNHNILKNSNQDVMDTIIV